jgi:predicted nucleic acid-binding protein
LTDIYLLALAVKHGGRFVTFDAKLSREAVQRAESKHLLVL